MANRSQLPAGFLASVLGLSLVSGIAFAKDADWNRKSIYYQVFVRSFYDGNGDGTGDMQGLTAKLDYLKDLGVDVLWLMPIHPSPSYHGYDVRDYQAIHPDFGTMKDFDALVKAAHKRGLKIILDYVANHTSSEHPWFQKALAGDKKYIDYYLWSDKAENGSWGLQKNGKYAYFTFGPQSLMPDLNYQNPALRADMIKAAQFWIKKGVDGFRLDVAQAIGDNDDEITLGWWKEFKQAVRKLRPDAFIIGELNFDKPSGYMMMAPYFAELDSSFNFPLYNVLTLFAANVQNDLTKTVNASLESYREYNPQAMDCITLGNHDRQRLASFLKSDPAKLRKAFALLLSLPGRPFIYYGDEIGMRGGHEGQGDPLKREPMDWYAAAKGPGQVVMDEKTYSSSAKNLSSSDGISVEEGAADPQSLFSYVKRLIRIRKENPFIFEADLQRVGTPAGLFAYKLSSAGSDSSITVVHNQDFGAEASITLSRDALELISGKSYKAGESLKLEAYASAFLRCAGANAPLANHPIIDSPHPPSKLTVRVHVPEDTPEPTTIWMPNSTDSWDAKTVTLNDGLKLKKVGERLYEISVVRDGGTRMEYKFFRGGWETSETHADGNWNGNREFLFVNPDTTVEVFLDGWRDTRYKGDK